MTGLLFRRLLALMLAIQLWPMAAGAGERVHVGVAANFKPLFAELAQRFEQESGHQVVISSASSGKLFNQLHHGAPFQLFLSADLQRPQQLQQEGLTIPDSLFVYAIGRLVLWSPDPKRFARGTEALMAGELLKIALGNPRTVPYGKAAEETLHNLGLSRSYAERLIVGEDVGQVMAFALSGNVDAGFLSLAQILDPQGQPRPGSYWEVPAHLHQPIQQAGVRIKSAGATEATLALVRYLRTPPVQALLQKRGYLLPPTPQGEQP
ncbi:MAG: molybdate ABC transporter substrate-binding protein [Magnetococcales bacterium]|nr:molybdate ABC transporter substrate-binding protein [Magnetococcales bacterium]